MMARYFMVEGKRLCTSAIYSIAKKHYGFKGCKNTIVNRLNSKPVNLTWAYLAANPNEGRAKVGRKNALARFNKIRIERKEIGALMEELNKRKAELAKKIADENGPLDEDE